MRNSADPAGQLRVFRRATFYELVIYDLAMQPMDMAIAMHAEQVDKDLLLEVWDGADLCPAILYANPAIVRFILDMAVPRLAPGLGVKFVETNLREEHFLREGGAEALESLVAGGVGIADTMWAQATQGQSLASVEDRERVENSLVERYQAVPHVALREKYVRDVRSRINSLPRLARAKRPVIRSNGHSNHSTTPGAIKLTKGLDSGGFTLREADLIVSLVSTPGDTEQMFSAPGVSERTRHVLDEIAYLIGTVPETELRAAVGRLPEVDEARAVLRSAGLSIQ